MDQKTILGNVNVLDVRKTPKETFDKLSFIKNVNIVLVSDETAGYLPGIPTKNLNAVAHVPANVEVQTCMSHLTLNTDYFTGFSAPKFLLIMGHAIVEPDVSQELIDEKIDGMVIMGKLVCPASLSGALQSKAKLLMGRTVIYPEDAILVTRSLTLDDAFLNRVPDGAKLVVTGSLRVLDDISPDLIERKLESLQVEGSILCRQECEFVLKSKLAPGCDMIVIPTAHRLIEGTLTLDPMTLQSVDSESFFGMGDIFISKDTEAEMLDHGVASMKCLGVIVCPSRLKDVLKTKCDMLGNRVVLYDGALWYVDDDRELLPEQFEYIEEPMTIVNRADLTIGSSVPPQTILDRIHKIHNLGDIICQPEHIPAIEARLGLREGDVVQQETDTDETNEGPTIGNANYLVL
jgi:hypothetical protein